MSYNVPTMTTTAASEAITKAAAAKAAGRRLAYASTDQKNEALHRIADALVAEQAHLLEVNAGDVQRGQERGLNESFVDRLALSPERIAGIAADTRQVATLEDPIGHIEEMRTRPNGLQIGRMRVPLGVIGAVYESRPNVTVDIAALCLKSGNATVLRSGSDAHATSSAFAAIVTRSVERAGLPAGIVQFIDSTDREEVGAMLKAHEHIDLMIPRGGADLIRRVRDEATMPVVAGGIGVCHTYIDAEADLEMARRIVVNAKTRRPSICNALDTVLVHAAVAEQLLPELSRELGERNVILHTDERARPLCSGAHTLPVEPEDYDREWLSLDCSVRVVDSLEDALKHIEDHGSGHSEAIVTNSYASSRRFLAEADAAAVYVNASTQFTDGAQFGLGAEIGISTQKMHARGPMALRELTSYKWIIFGEGQTRPL
ncbi:MAG: glutamate-5-semialdehyde dehydrogenase [Dehalococcoidia bacterium]